MAKGKPESSTHIDSAKKMLEDERRAREEQCAKDITTMLAEARCTLVVTVADAPSPNHFGFGVVVKAMD